MADWVCDECGIDYGTLTVEALPGRIEPFPARWRELLAGVDDGVLRRRPEAATWSPVEYAAHVRDVVDDLTRTVRAMAAGSGPPAFGDPDAEVVERRYAEQDLAAVLDGIDASTGRLLEFVRDLTPEVAAVEAAFPWGSRDVLAMTRNAVHEHTHHLFDVQRILAGSAATPDTA